MLPALGVSWRDRKIAEGLRTSFEPRLAHREHADLVGGAEAVLHGAHHAVAAAAVALEIQHGVDHVLQHARAGDHAFLGHVTDEQHRRSGSLGETHQRRGGFAQLRDGSRGRIARLACHGLDGIDDRDAGFHAFGLGDHSLHRGLGDQRRNAGLQPEAARTYPHLLEGLFTGCIEDWSLGADADRRLEQQRGLADTGVATQ